jgi:two-component system LytT family response regulator
VIRALIVDDEPLARRRIASLLQEHADFTIVGEAAHGEQAIDDIQALRPDVVFLDVQMPVVGGFDVVEAIGAEAMPHTVFVTAYDVHAIRAFEVEALDYVLKPFDDLRFGRVLDRVRRVRSGDASGARLAAAVRACAPKRLVARSGGRVRIVHWDDVDWIAAAGDYAEVHARGQVLLINETITALAARLPTEVFARVHRSTIVRLDKMAELRLEAHGDGVLKLASGSELRVSRRYRDAVDRFLGLT